MNDLDRTRAEEQEQEVNTQAQRDSTLAAENPPSQISDQSVEDSIKRDAGQSDENSPILNGSNRSNVDDLQMSEDVRKNLKEAETPREEVVKEKLSNSTGGNYHHLKISIIKRLVKSFGHRPIDCPDF